MTGTILAAALAIVVGFSAGFVVGALFQGIRRGGVMDLHLENAEWEAENADLQTENYDLRRRLNEHRQSRLPQPRAGRPPIRSVNGSNPA